MICPECNSEINENVKFCEYCGHEFPKQIIYQQSQPQKQPILNTIKPENNVLKLQIVQEKANPRIRELEEKIENYLSSGILMIFCFYPVAIYLFIMRAKYKKELYFLKNPEELKNVNNPNSPSHPNYNLGWKTFGMWWLYYFICAMIWFPIMTIVSEDPDIMFISPIGNISMMLIMLIPTILAYFWHKKHKVQI